MLATVRLWTVALGDGVAVTNAHTADLVDERLVIGVSHDYDLMFFHTDKRVVPLAIEAPLRSSPKTSSPTPTKRIIRTSLPNSCRPS